MEKKTVFKILVVDDTPELLDITLRILQKEKYLLYSASNGKECIDILHREHPDIILLDVMLPDINGIDLCRKIKNDPDFSLTYIILLSGFKIDSVSISEGLEDGADGYIIRPVSNRELLARVSAACRSVEADRRIKYNEIILQACINSPKNIIILAIDANYNYLSFNTCHKEVMLDTYGTEIRAGMNLLECMTKESDIKKAKKNYDLALAGESHITLEEFGEKQRYYYETRYNPIYNERNEIIGATAFSEDVTEGKKTEESLKKSEEKFRKSFITSPDSVNINRLSDGMYVSINNGFTRITGYSEEDAIGKTSVEINVWTDPADREKLIHGLRTNGNVENLMAVFRSKDGTFRYGMMSASVIELEGIPHILSITRDITEIKEMELALRESENKYRDLIELAPDGILLGSLDGVITGANTKMLRLTGRSLDSLIGSSINILFSEEELNKVPLRYDLLKQGETIINIRNILHIDRTIIPVEMHTKMMPDGSYQAFIHDISDRKQIENEIRKLVNHYQALIEKAPDGIVLINSEGNFKYVSPSARKIFGFLPTDEIPENPAVLMHPDDLPMVLTELRKIFADPSYAPTLMYRFLTKGGEWIWIETTFSNLLSDPSVESIVLNFRNITDRRLAEESIKSKVDELQWFNNMMINREVKMIELKKEINSLLVSQGKEEKYVIHEKGE